MILGPLWSSNQINLTTSTRDRHRFINFVESLIILPGLGGLLGVPPIVDSVSERVCPCLIVGGSGSLG